MIDIIISITFSLLVVINFIFIVVEICRRHRYKMNSNIIEANLDIRISIFSCLLGAIFIAGCTIAYYVPLFCNADLLGYFILCLIGLLFIIVAYINAFNKVIIDKKTASIYVYRFFLKRRYLVSDINLIKVKSTAWIVYSNGNRLFKIEDKNYLYPLEFYSYICELSKCEIIHEKGYTSRGTQ